MFWSFLYFMTAYMAVYRFMEDRGERGWIHPKCGNEMSRLRHHWTTRQRTYRIRGVSGDYIRVCTRVRYATGKQLNTYIDAYAGCTHGHLCLPSGIQATLNARVTTAIKIFFNISQSLLCNLLNIVIVKSEHCNIMLRSILYFVL